MRGGLKAPVWRISPLIGQRNCSDWDRRNIIRAGKFKSLTTGFFSLPQSHLRWYSTIYPNSFSTPPIWIRCTWFRCSTLACTRLLPALHQHPLCSAEKTNAGEDTSGKVKTWFVPLSVTCIASKHPCISWNRTIERVSETFWSPDMLMLNASGVTNLCEEPASRATLVIMPYINFP